MNGRGNMTDIPNATTPPTLLGIKKGKVVPVLN
jgi:hypothetical protein